MASSTATSCTDYARQNVLSASGCPTSPARLHWVLGDAEDQLWRNPALGMQPDGSPYQASGRPPKNPKCPLNPKPQTPEPLIRSSKPETESALNAETSSQSLRAHKSPQEPKASKHLEGFGLRVEGLGFRVRDPKPQLYSSTQFMGIVGIYKQRCRKGQLDERPCFVSLYEAGFIFLFLVRVYKVPF